MLIRKIIRFLFLLIAALLLIASAAFLTALYYKKEIMKSLKADLNQRINGNIEVKDIRVNFLQHFPNLSLSLIDMKVSDSLYHIHQKHLFAAQKISFSVSLYALINRHLEVQEITISDGSVYLFKDSTNYFNGNILRKDTSQHLTPSSDLPIDFTLKKIELRNVAFTYEDPSKQRKIAFVNERNTIKVDIKPEEVLFVLKGNYHVDQLTFKETKGSFLRNKEIELTLRGNYNLTQNRLSFDDSEVAAEGEKYGLKGMLVTTKPAELTLEINSSNASLEKVKALLTERISSNLSKIKLNKRAAGSAKIFAILAPNNQPEVDISFEVKDSPVGYKKWKAYAKSIKGSYCNHADSTKPIGDENSLITFAHFEGSYLTIPVSGTATIKNIKTPFIEASGISKGSMDLFNTFLNPDKMEFESGKFKLDFTLKGLVEQFSNKKKLGSEKSYLQIKGKVAGGRFKYYPRSLDFASINGTFSCDWNDLKIQSLNLLLNKNSVRVKGNVTNLTAFLIAEGEKVRGDFYVSSPGVVFDHFSFTKESYVRKKKNRETMDDVVARMDKLIDVVELNLNFNTPRFNFHNFEAQDINGTITAINSDFILNNFSFKSAKGTYKFSGAFRNIGTDAAYVKAKGNIMEADVQEVFASFDNFKQNTIGEKNLRGKINATIDFTAGIDHGGNLLPETMRGDFAVQVKNGHLIDFDPIQKLGGFIFKNRDFKNISFEDIQNRFILKGKTLSVGKMEIISSVFTLYVDGVHNFDSYTDLNIQAPVSNLRKRSKVKKVKEENGVKNVGVSVYVKAYSDGKKMKFTYQPFKTFKGNKVQMNQDSVGVY